MLTPQDIINKDIFTPIEEFALCKICKGILIKPVKCNECDCGFCLNCAKKWEIEHRSCPNGCKSFFYKESRLLKGMLDKLEFQCKNGCGMKLTYEDAFTHIYETCTKRDFKPEYLELKKEYLKLQQTLKDIQNNERSREADYFQHLIPKYHPHPLIQGYTPLRRGYICNICRSTYTNKTLTYYCTYCDFDVCTSCFDKEK